MRYWDYASRSARKGNCWVQAAVDRKRFQNRISTVEDTLKKVLHPDHREKIFNERFKEEENLC